jgi:protein-S-isoprenylcysteine O-methyltransferase Ste14
MTQCNLIRPLPREVKTVLDIRIPIGLMFGLLGLILTIFGLASGSQIYDLHSLGININLWWGVVLLSFGAVLLLMAWRTARRHKAPLDK